MQDYSKGKSGYETRDWKSKHFRTIYLNTYIYVCVFHFRVVFFKLIDETNPGVDDHNSCTGDTCPIVSFTITSGDLDDGDCTGRAYPKYQRDPDVR